MNNISRFLPDHWSENETYYLATVVRSKGSAPQKSGSSALISSKGLIAGTVGGGIVEARVLDKAAELGLTKESAFFDFDLSNEISDIEESVCGGALTILIEYIGSDKMVCLSGMKETLQQGGSGVMLVLCEKAEYGKLSVGRKWYAPGSSIMIEGLTPAEEKEVNEFLSQAHPENSFEELSPLAFNLSGRAVYAEYLKPMPVLVIAGAGHVGRALTHLAALTGFSVVVVDDRAEYANASRLPEAAEIITGDIAASLKALRKDRNTYIVIVTHGHKHDASALRACLGSDLAYLGMIGSRTKVDAMKKEFMEKGWVSSEQWQRIYAPVGLSIGSRTVEEIAVSIIAQLIQVRSSMGKTMEG